MRKILTALVAAASVGAAAITTSSPASAWGGWGWGWGWGLGGFAVGAIIGSALAAPYYHPYPYYYGYGPYYSYYGAPCRPAWNGYAWVRACY